MTCPLYILNEETPLLTTAWTAQQGRTFRGKEYTDIAYTWGADGSSWMNNAVSTRRIKIDMPFHVFLAYANDCLRDNAIINLGPEQIERILHKYAVPLEARPYRP